LKAIQHFEKLLNANGTVILKFFLHVSNGEQRKRLEARIQDPRKRWKLSPTDLADRKKWKAFQKAYEEAITATSTNEAPWFIVPADHKWYRNWVVGHLVVQALEALHLRTPKPDPRLDFKTLKVA
jgi:polyphosphate kinase 2 (PPK2 family)